MNIIRRNSTNIFKRFHLPLSHKTLYYHTVGNRDKDNLMEQQINEEKDYETFEKKKNLVLVEDKFTDFQKTFGFYEDLEELKKQNEQKEKRRFYTFGLGALFGIGLITGVLLIGIDPALEKSFKRAYYVHLCNLKLKKNDRPINQTFFILLEQNILNTRGSSKKKIIIIEEYLQKMKGINLKQPAYNLVLVDEIKAIIQRHSLLNDLDIIQQCLDILSDIQIIMVSSPKYCIYMDEYFKHLESIAFCLIQNNINLQTKSFLQICEYGFTKSNDSKTMNTFMRCLTFNKFNLNEKPQEVIDQFIKKSQQIVKDFNVTQEEFQFKKQTENKYINIDDFIIFNALYNKEYYKSIIYQVSKLVNELDLNKKQKYEQEIKDINHFLKIEN